MSEDKEQGCGISKLWMTPREDPFFSSCQMHDGMYTKGSPIQDLLSRKEADTLFLKHMLNNSRNDWRLKARAYLYYAIVRLIGGLWWEGKK